MVGDNTMREKLSLVNDIENSVIGSCLLDIEAIGRVYGLISYEMFYSDANKIIFKAITDLWSSGSLIDLLTVNQKLIKDGNAVINGDRASLLLTKSTNSVVSTSHLENHAMMLKDLFVERETERITKSGISSDRVDIYSEVGRIQESLNKLLEVKAGNDFRSIDNGIISVYKHMEMAAKGNLVGVSTGLKTLDKLTGGFRNGAMIIVAARPSVGKSAIMGRMVLGAAKQGKKVGIISLEMTEVQLTSRLASLETNVEYHKIDKGIIVDAEERDRFYNIMNSQLANYPIYISEKLSVNLAEIRAKASKMKKMNMLDILFIDYLGLIDEQGARGQSREQIVSGISRGLKLLAMELNIPIVVLSQLNRMSEQAGDKKPKLFHLRESGSLEQDCDLALLLHRDWMSGIQVNENGESTESEADLIVAKNRGGEIGTLKLGFNGQKMRFYEFGENKEYHSRFD
jgi:replicative DNA helicase